MSKLGKSTETECRLVVARGPVGGVNGEWLIHGYEVPTGGYKNVLELDGGRSCMTLNVPHVTELSLLNG